MQSRWSDAEANAYVAKYGEQWGTVLALRTYLSTLIGAEERLVLHGGGNGMRAVNQIILGIEHQFALCLIGGGALGRWRTVIFAKGLFAKSRFAKSGLA